MIRTPVTAWTQAVADETFVVVPAYNEARAIRPVVERLLPLGLHIVVVDDASTDGTPEQLHGLPVTVLSHAVNLGQGAALQTGIDFACVHGAGFVVTFDADGQHDEMDIPALVAPLAAGGVDVVLASRFLGTDPAGMPPARRLLLRAAIAYTRWTTGLPLTDAHNGLRAFRAGVASSLRITQNRMAHASELLQKLRAARLSYREVPALVRYTQYSRTKGQAGLGALDILYDLLIGRLLR